MKPRRRGQITGHPNMIRNLHQAQSSSIKRRQRQVYLMVFQIISKIHFFLRDSQLIVLHPVAPVQRAPLEHEGAGFSVEMEHQEPQLRLIEHCTTFGSQQRTMGHVFQWPWLRLQAARQSRVWSTKRRAWERRAWICENRNRPCKHRAHHRD